MRLKTSQPQKRLLQDDETPLVDGYSFINIKKCMAWDWPMTDTLMVISAQQDQSLQIFISTQHAIG